LKNFGKLEFYGEYDAKEYSKILNKISDSAGFSLEQFRTLFYPLDPEYAELLNKVKEEEISEHSLGVVRNFFSHLIKLELVKDDYLKDHLQIFKDLNALLPNGNSQDQVKNFLHDSGFLVTNKELKFLWKSFSLNDSFKPTERTFEELVAFLASKF
jgi:hypothetical protein